MSRKLTTTDRDNLAYLLVQAFRWTQLSTRALLDDPRVPQNLTATQIMLLANLGEDGLRLSDLARKLGVSRQAIHQQVRPAVDAKLVEIVDDGGPGGAKRVMLTKAGRAIDRRAVGLVHEIEAELIGRIGKRRVAELRAALETDWGPPIAEITDADG